MKDPDLKRLAVALGAGVTMSFLMWLFVSESSPAYEYLKDQDEAGFAMLILNFPALLATRLFFHPNGTIACTFCFVQWFAIGMFVASRIWPADADPMSTALTARGSRTP